jgi:hypothetical protein
VINLNLRSVVAEPDGPQTSILERLITRMTQKEYWEPCASCDLKDKCYAYHNACTFQYPLPAPAMWGPLLPKERLSELKNAGE